MQLNTLLCGQFHMLSFTNTYSLPRHGYGLLIIVVQSEINRDRPHLFESYLFFKRALSNFPLFRIRLHDKDVLKWKSFHFVCVCVFSFFLSLAYRQQQCQNNPHSQIHEND